MAADSKIEWTTHTFNPRSLCSVLRVVTRFAKRDAIGNIEAQFRKISKGLDVVRVQVAAPTIATFLTGELVTKKNIVAPPFVVTTKTLVTTFGEFSVFEAVTGFSPMRSFSRYLANFSACFKRMLNAGAITAALLSRLAHLEA